MRAIVERDYKRLRQISDFFYAASGIYQTVCNYFAYLYRYDWYIYPENVKESAKNKNVIEEYTKILSYLDGSYIKKLCGDIALKVVKYGCYYGYIIDSNRGVTVQELPPEYCRTRYSVGGVPAIEFNMAFFDTVFPEVSYRMKVLDLFPPEFKKGYTLYKQHKLPPDYPVLDAQITWGSWYLLDPGLAFKFGIMGLRGLPLFVNAIPSLIDLDITQGIDRKRQLQQLLKIIVQKLPLDKNGD